eukprot:CAMPEP_0204175294 /NCGR_PEP_ID=MMETSP0361-20130328/46620_1 /ASSEMBLY_ACC=CAM_ASM_000343 /TAXON_ID=268821 /ORGANISM="Scrippsiella Hangoei, Strain SHTV-5" /LENGTH=105 /DNA_ID=CAMNT_0051133921 /DNA_START=1685 /DNA_END=2002 /DNA_ORIENTATION=+
MNSANRLYGGCGTLLVHKANHPMQYHPRNQLPPYFLKGARSRVGDTTSRLPPPSHHCEQKGQFPSWPEHMVLQIFEFSSCSNPPEGGLNPPDASDSMSIDASPPT